MKNIEIVDTTDTQDRYDLAYTAFKFGYMQGCTTNKPGGKRTESKAGKLWGSIGRVLDRLTVDELKGVDVFLYTLFGLEALNERQD